MSRFDLLRRGVAALSLLAAAALPTRAEARTVTATCTVGSAVGCSALRFQLADDAAPWALQSFSVTLGGGWSFGAAPATTVTGEDAFSFGTPFTADAQVGGGGASLLVDFLASPGFTFELFPGVTGYLDVAVQSAGSAAATFSYAIVDPDGATSTGGGAVAPAVVTPEPATIGLLAAGVAALALARRRRA